MNHVLSLGEDPASHLDFTPLDLTCMLLDEYMDGMCTLSSLGRGSVSGYSLIKLLDLVWGGGGERKVPHP
jgi:hypothetical protein